MIFPLVELVRKMRSNSKCSDEAEPKEFVAGIVDNEAEFYTGDHPAQKDLNHGYLSESCGLAR